MLRAGRAERQVCDGASAKLLSGQIRLVGAHQRAVFTHRAVEMWCGRPDAGVADALVEPEHVPLERGLELGSVAGLDRLDLQGSRELT
jgi:hypothetical protein